MNLARYATYWANMRGDKLAAVFRNQRLSWAELDRQANAVAAALQDLGVDKGDRVGCLLANCLEWVITWTAVLKVGGILVPLNPRYGDAELKEISASANCSVIVSLAANVERLDPHLAAQATDAAAVHLFPMTGRGTAKSFAGAIAGGGMPREASRVADDIAVITFTSGSTGLPKGAVLTHKALDTVAFSMLAAFRYTSEDRMLLLAPFAFTGGSVCVYVPAYIVGACIFIEESFDPEAALATITREGITVMKSVPIMWERMAASPHFAGADLSSLKTATIGGAPVPQSLLQRYVAKGVSLVQTYGCTEASGYIAIPSRENGLAKPWSCGGALSSLDVRVVDTEDVPCPAGEVGEILLRGPQMFSGYWNDPKSTQESWRGGWYHTGDLGRLDECGHVQITDRKKNMVISGGVNVYPAEVERAMSAIPGVAEVLVFGVPDPVWGERVVAIVHGDDSLDPEDVMRHARSALGSYKTPKEIIVSRRTLPRTSSGKVLRARLAELYGQMREEPRTTSESPAKAAGLAAVPPRPNGAPAGDTNSADLSLQGDGRSASNLTPTSSIERSKT